MAVNLSPVGGAAAQFFDNSGQVLTGGKLYTYLAGTTTPAVTYTTNSGITAHPNPIVLNAAGRVPDSGEIWLSDGILYKFVLKDSNDVQIAVWDNIDGINSNFVNYTTQDEVVTATQGQTVFTLTSIQYTPATNNLAVYVNGSKQILTLNYIETSSTVVTFIDGLNVGDEVQFTTASAVATNVIDASNVSYNEGQAGAVNRNVQSRLQDYVSVKDFGAVGDGTADDTAAIQDAINATEGQNPAITLLFPNGVYKVSSPLTISNVLVLKGESATSSVIKNTSATNDIILFSIGNSIITGCGVEDISIISTVAKTSGAAIYFSATLGGSFYKSFVKNVSTDANMFIGVAVNACYFLDLQNVTIGGVRAQGKGFDFIGLASNNEVASVYMSNCRVLSGISGGSTLGFHFGSYTEGFYCDALTAESTGLDYGFVFDNSLSASNYTPKNMWFTNCIADNAQVWNWYFTDGQSMHLTSCWGTSAVTGGGIYLGSNVVDVTLSDFSAIANGGPGVELDTCNTVKIVGCTITGNSATTSNTNNGIYVKANTNDFIVANCRFNRYGATPSHFADIYIETGTSNNYIIHDNNLDGYVTTPINDGGTGNAAKIHDNINYNPATTMGFPTPSASPYTYTAGHTPETVYFQGGTISSIAYLGQPLFNTTGVGVPLGPNEAIVVTYSSAPTIRVVRH